MSKLANPAKLRWVSIRLAPHTLAQLEVLSRVTSHSRSALIRGAVTALLEPAASAAPGKPASARKRRGASA